MQCCDLDMIFDPAVVTLTFKTCLNYLSETVRCRRFIFVRDNGYGV